jgi:hypothetical protein
LAHRGVDAAEWALMTQQAKVLVATGFLPAHIKTPEQALGIMLKAREINIPPMYGLSNIAVIQGKPVCNAELMLALIYRDHGDGAIVIEHSDDEACRIVYRRRTAPAAQRYAFTLEDAKRAGLLANQTWQKYPAAMLRARCISAVARMAFPDSIGGMYTPDALGARTEVDAEGAVTLAVDEPSPARAPVPAVYARAPQAQAPAAAQEEPLSGDELAAYFSATEQPDEPPATPSETLPASIDPARNPSLKPAPTAVDVREIAREIFARMKRIKPGTAVELPAPDDPENVWTSFVDTYGPVLEETERELAAKAAKR